VSLPPIPDYRRIPSVSNAVQDLLREPEAAMFLDMGQGSREQSMPVHDSEVVCVIASKQAETADKP
jgi:hypothetical protein